MRLAFLLAAASLWAADRPEWSPNYTLRFRTVSDVTPAPNGAHVLWTESAALIDKEKSEYLTHIFLARVDATGRLQLTRGDKSCTAPQFAPDSQSVFFLSTRAGKRNLYRIALTGGEAEKLTDVKADIGAFSVSPDGRRVAFTAPEEDKDLEQRRKEKTDFKIVDDSPRNHFLWIVELNAPQPAQPRRLVTAAYHIGAFDWSPDSRHIAFEHRARPEIDEERHADIAEVEIATGVVRELAVTSATETGPLYSPDGRYLLLERTAPKPRRVDGHRLVLLTRDTAAVRELPATPNEQPSVIGWSPDSQSVFFSELQGTRAAIFRLPIDGPVQTVFKPSSGTVGPAVRANRTATHFGFVRQSPTEAPEACLLPAASGKPLPVSAANSEVPIPAMGKTELIRWKGKDGLDIEGLLTYPTNHTPGARVPLILYVHGGPAGAFSETFLGVPGLYPLAAFSAKGWAILRANPRGSTAYGARFRQRVIQDWGGLDFLDLQAGVDHCIHTLQLADPARLAIAGWSYGGYMTAWSVTQTTRFRAAAMGAAITNHVSMYGTQDIPSVYEDYFGGPPWQFPAVYAKSSPINFVQRVKTPTLILHGESDNRVPVTQGYEYYRALKRQNVPTRMVVFPRQGHGITEPKFQLQVMQEHLDWFAKHLQ